MALLTLLLPLIAQVGPFTAPGTRGTPFPEKVERPARVRGGPAKLPMLPPARTGRAQECVSQIEDDAEAAVDTAAAWLGTAKAGERAEAGLCLGLAQSRLEQWDDAEAAFLGAREAAGSDRVMRARLGAMAGNAALAAGQPDRAIAALDVADADAKALAEAPLTAGIALDRARALVSLKRESEAATALAEARAAGPDNAEAWLLSATLSRRQGKLVEAQAQILKAAELLPIDPAIGLEAGVIAMQSGHEAAARRSWQSVITAAPGSPQAATAQGYLAQLGPAAARPAPTPGAGR
ncbi:MAG: tetratricopeptide repeat protein [Pseudomonadota bacterium]